MTQTRMSRLWISYNGRDHIVMAAYEGRADRQVRRTMTLMSAQAELLGVARSNCLTVSEPETGLRADRT